MELVHFGLDIAVLITVVLFALIGAKKGFIKACADFIGAFAAMIAAGILSRPAAEWVYYTFFHDALMEKIAAAITGLDAVEAVQAVFSEFPAVIRRALAAVGISESGVIEQVEGSVLDIAESITTAISPMLISFVQVLAMVVLFILLLVVIRALASFLTGLFELPVLHSVNGLLGAVFGILMGIIAIWIVLACVQAFLPLLSSNMQQRITELLEQSVLFEKLYDFNPAYSLIG